MFSILRTQKTRMRKRDAVRHRVLLWLLLALLFAVCVASIIVSNI